MNCCYRNCDAIGHCDCWNSGLDCCACGEVSNDYFDEDYMDNDYDYIDVDDYLDNDDDTGVDWSLYDDETDYDNIDDDWDPLDE